MLSSLTTLSCDTTADSLCGLWSILISWPRIKEFRLLILDSSWKEIIDLYVCSGNERFNSTSFSGKNHLNYHSSSLPSLLPGPLLTEPNTEKCVRNGLKSKAVFVDIWSTNYRNRLHSGFTTWFQMESDFCISDFSIKITIFCPTSLCENPIS